MYNLPVFLAFNILGLVWVAKNQGNLLPNDSCALKRKVENIRIESFRLRHTVDETPRSRMPHVELTYFFRYKYTGFNIDCHVGHMKGETRAIFSQMTLPDEE